MHRVMSTRIALVVALMVGGGASANPVAAEFTGSDLYVEIDGYLDGNYYMNAYAGELTLDVDGVEHGAWCVDLDHLIQYGPYEAELVASPVDDVSCQMAYMYDTYYPVGDDLASAAFQVALWKRMSEPSVFTVSQSDVEAEAALLLAEGAGKCPMTCQDTAEIAIVGQAANGLVDAVVTLTEGGAPVYGGQVVIASTEGVVLDPPGGVAETDPSGEVQVTIDLQGATTPPTLSASAEGMWFYDVAPLNNVYQQTLAIPDGTCSAEGEVCVDLLPRLDLGLAMGHNVFSCMDWYGGYHVEGTTAIANRAYFHDFNLGYGTQGGDVLVVGDNLALKDGTVWGNAVNGGLQIDLGGVTFDNGGSWSAGTPIDFTTACDDLRTTSDELAAFTPDGSVHVFPSGAIKLVGTDEGTNVFELPALGVLNPSTHLVIVAPPDSKVLINVLGPYVQFVGMQIDLVGIDPEDVLFNLPDLSFGVVKYTEFKGSILAPFGTMNVSWGEIHGTLAVGDLRGCGHFFDRPFEGSLADGEHCPN